MNAHPVSPLQLLAFITAVSLALCAFVAFMYNRFSRFLDRERKKGEAFRAVHRGDRH